MEKIRKQVGDAVRALFGVEVRVVVSAVPEGMEGDYACNVALQITREVGKSPREVAGEIREWLARETGDFSVEVAGPGFLNFTLGSSALVAELDGLEVAGASRKYEGKVVVSEFSDPNPFKVLHVGHLYTSVVGDGLSRLVEYAGGKVHRVNFGGDVGMHVAKTIWEILRRGEVDRFLEMRLGEKMEYIAECYVAGTQAYDAGEVRGEIEKLNKVIYEISEGKDKDSLAARVYWAGREASYRYFDEFYERIGLGFEKYYPESEVAGLGLSTVRAHLGEVYEESDGAVVYRGEKVGLHTRVFINREGLPTYEAKDVGLIEQKWRDYEFDESIVITAAEQKDYMKVVLASVAEFDPELVARTRHYTHGMVKLPGAVKMSSRAGNFLRAVDVIDMVVGEGMSEMVAIAAIKYAFLKVKMEGDIAFDVKESVNMQGNSGPYLQYAVVRGKSILRELEKNRPGAAGTLGDDSTSGMKSQELSRAKSELGKVGGELDRWERGLAVKLLWWRSAASEAVEELAPHKVCAYLYELAQEFSRFYEHDRVVGGENEMLRRRLVEKYVEVLGVGLGLLGIVVPEKM